ncbi:MAG: hypothetical protein KA479_14145, partial [Saprospiraceae bacterium]|nr:hypothetical protein [Saprospiraceae bacterium]
MKPLFFFVALLFISGSLRSQEIGWYNMDQQSGHMVTLHVGADFVTGFGLSYGYKFKGKFPFVIGTELTTPFGGQIMDDFKASLTAQTIFRPANYMGITVKPSMTCRRYGSDAAVLVNISAGLSATVGYYRDNWSVAAEAGYDHSSATLIKPRLLKEYYPGSQEDWFGSTGGNFNFGLVTSYWIGQTGVSLKGGKTFGQNFDDNPTLPYYADFSLMRK